MQSSTSTRAARWQLGWATRAYDVAAHVFAGTKPADR